MSLSHSKKHAAVYDCQPAAAYTLIIGDFLISLAVDTAFVCLSVIYLLLYIKAFAIL